MAKHDRSSPVPFAALCAVLGCTAIIDGEFDAPARPPIAHGSQSGLEGVNGTSLGGEASALQGGSASDRGIPDPSDAGAAGDRAPGGGAGGAPAAESGGTGTAGGQPEGGMSSGGAEHAGASEATGGEPASGGTGSGANGGTSSGAIGGSAGTSSGGGTNDDVITWKGPLPPGDPAKGHLLVIADKCSSCHAENFGGRGFYRNITPDVTTGIGGWTDRQIANAIRGGGGPGTQFCSVMPLYSGLKDRQVADMVAYLRSIPAVSNQIVSICPGHYPPGR